MFQHFIQFVTGAASHALKGSRTYYTWVAFLLCLITYGAWGYAHQYQEGLILTGMRDQVMWGFYIGNFTFMVGVAAAAVVLVIPAYVYHWGPIYEIAIIGELLAISAMSNPARTFISASAAIAWRSSGASWRTLGDWRRAC